MNLPWKKKQGRNRTEFLDQRLLKIETFRDTIDKLSHDSYEISSTSFCIIFLRLLQQRRLLTANTRGIARNAENPKIPARTMDQRS